MFSLLILIKRWYSSIFNIRGFPAWDDNTMLKINKLVMNILFPAMISISTRVVFSPPPFVQLITLSWVLDHWSRISSYGYDRKCTIISLLRLNIYFWDRPIKLDKFKAISSNDVVLPSLNLGQDIWKILFQCQRPFYRIIIIKSKINWIWQN